ncbi:GerMN domain-containing protein [Patescibacteria group bacterium]|nr:GerMN domain-containing protein [Patescibacteria group bacterium]
MSKQKWVITGFLVLVLIVAVLLLRLFSGDEDTWLCQNGQWVKHGNPSAPMPTASCGAPIASPTPTPPAQSDIEVFYPQPGATVRSLLILEGRARGSWFFEASAPIKLLDGQGKEIAVSFIQAIGDWMTTDFVPFTGELKFSASSTINGVLVFNNDNPSGLPENSKEFRVPVIISPEQATVVKIFFNNDRLDPEFSCNKVFAASREISKTQALARGALEELLKGPTENEKLLGFSTSINSGVKIQKLTITDGVAKVDFDEQLEFQVGGSCRVAAIRAQITETLKQFSAVQSVVISIDGRTEDILQP